MSGCGCVLVCVCASVCVCLCVFACAGLYYLCNYPWAVIMSIGRKFSLVRINLKCLLKIFRN